MEEEYSDEGAAAAVTRYLLGELAEDEQRRFEEEFMSGARTFEELLAAEDELVDRYVAGDLAGRERERFEDYFLATPERRRKLAFARTLHRYVADAGLGEINVEGATPDQPSRDVPPGDEAETGDPSTDSSSTAPSSNAPAPPPARSPFARYAAAALFILVVAAGSLLLLNALRQPGDEGPALAFTLTPGAVRGTSDGGGVKQLQIAPGTGTVELRLSINAAPAAEPPRYRADIASVDADRAVFSTAEDARPVNAPDGTAHIPVRLPARLLTPGGYRLRLAAAPPGRDFQDVATYYFTVAR